MDGGKSWRSKGREQGGQVGRGKGSRGEGIKREMDEECRRGEGGGGKLEVE